MSHKINISVVLFSLIFSVFSQPITESETKDENMPARSNAAAMARYIVHNSDWAALGTISLEESIKGYPYVGIQSIADGTKTNASGIPYMMTTDMDTSIKDLKADNRCTLFMSLAQGDYCKKKNLDPLSHQCARVALIGSIEKVDKDSAEYAFAKEALFARHPTMVSWPLDHGFYIAKLNVREAAVMADYGPTKKISSQEYFAAKL